MNTSHILKHVRLTEKSNQLSSDFSQYTLEVRKDANKHVIADAVEKAFKVTVTRVHVAHYRGKNKRSRTGRPGLTSDYKKAIVTLKKGDKIELL
ncbi:MAG: 50S ribosomal protein L23 [Opitutaceae bacterium]|jgi:large subunit ribosomal protein L23|nr:50S ribosomal protein L23 [Opitutaceae bacterium]